MKLCPNEIAHAALAAGFGTEPTACPNGQWTGEPLPVAVVMVAIAMAESGGNTDAIGFSPPDGSGENRDLGLFQISSRWWADLLAKNPRWRDPDTNALMARVVHVKTAKAFAGRGVDAGLTAWSTYTSGSWARYVPAARRGVAHPFPYTP